MANSVDPDQTALIGAGCSGSTLFASILNSSIMLALFAADVFSRRHFQMHFFLGALRVNIASETDKLFLVVWLCLTFMVNHRLVNWINEPARKTKCFSLLEPVSVLQKVQVGIYAYQRLRATCTSVQSDQSLWWAHKAIGNQGSNIFQVENQD